MQQLLQSKCLTEGKVVYNGNLSQSEPLGMVGAPYRTNKIVTQKSTGDQFSHIADISSGNWGNPQCSTPYTIWMTPSHSHQLIFYMATASHHCPMNIWKKTPVMETYLTFYKERNYKPFFWISSKHSGNTQGIPQNDWEQQLTNQVMRCCFDVQWESEKCLETSNCGRINHGEDTSC